MGRTIVLGAGKAAGEMAAVAFRYLKGDVVGLVVTRYGHSGSKETGSIDVMEAAHPVPDKNSVTIATKMMELAATAKSNDRVIFLISGGGSSLLTCPVDDISFEEKQAVSRHLVYSGATITEINKVRSALSKIKGGGLAQCAHKAQLQTLIISDVVGDDPTVIASGPSLGTDLDSNRVISILSKYEYPMSLNLRNAIENRQQKKRLDHPVEIIASSKDALTAVENSLKLAGWDVESLGVAIEGDATEIGKQHAKIALRNKKAGRKIAIISGGELTVKVKNPNGCGGPNLEYLTSLMMALGGTEGIHALSCDSDGIDGSEDNAGGLIDPSSFARLEQDNLKPAAALQKNETYNLFKHLDDLIITGPTGTNVNDIRIILVDGTGRND